MLLLPFGVSLFVSGVVCAYERNTSSDISYTDYDSILRRNDEIVQRLAEDTVQGVRKMTGDEGEKFLFEYWSFAGDEGNSTRDSLESRGVDENGYPAFLARSFPFQSASSLERSVGWSGLESRDFQCPTGTGACTSIGRSDRCCSSGSTCEIVTDTGSGDVGCCPSGETCSGTVGSCLGGYTTCSQTLGGGCCIPGYECVSGGCAYISVVTITVDSSVVVSTETHSTVPQSTHSTSKATTKATDTTATDTTATDTTATDNTTTDNTTTDTITTDATTTDSLVPPARPTSLSTTTHGTTSRADVCPTGFYACSAVYHGGCCQTGRDCDTTSCPTTSSTTFVSNGETIVMPVTTGGSSGTTGRCAKGWFSCADTVGGGCCPSGFACGQSCTATAAHSTVAKEQATGTSSGSRVERAWINWALGMSVLCIVTWI